MHSSEIWSEDLLAQNSIKRILIEINEANQLYYQTVQVHTYATRQWIQ